MEICQSLISKEISGMVKHSKTGKNECKLQELLIELFQIPLKQNTFKYPSRPIHEKSVKQKLRNIRLEQETVSSCLYQNAKGRSWSSFPWGAFPGRDVSEDLSDTEEPIKGIMGEKTWNEQQQIVLNRQNSPKRSKLIQVGISHILDVSRNQTRKQKKMESKKGGVNSP